MACRSLVEKIEKRIREQGILGSGIGNEDREDVVIDMIWEVYEEESNEK